MLKCSGAECVLRVQSWGALRRGTKRDRAWAPASSLLAGFLFTATAAHLASPAENTDAPENFGEFSDLQFNFRKRSRQLKICLQQP